ncbi:MAG: RuvA C-terminal domain-containing protein [Candidatus Eisenbacteria bacterium]
MRAQASTSDRTDDVLRQDLFLAADRDRVDNADFLELIADFDARRLYLPEGYSSMHAFCVGALRMCEDSAYKRIQAARAGWRHPQLFDALAGGRLHLTAIFLLAPHLTPANVDELMAAASHKTRREIRGLLGQRFLGSAAELRLETAPPPVVAEAPVEAAPVVEAAQLVPVPVASGAPESSQHPASQRVGPHLRVDVRCSVDAGMLDYARVLLSHRVPSGDLGKVLDYVLSLAIPQLEKKKFGLTARPRARATRRQSGNPRSIPAQVKRDVWLRDGGRCTFTGRDGHRCGERRFLEYDHVQPVALGGRSASATDLRLRCRAHNQFEAERVFGVGFMQDKRARARERRSRADARPGARADTRNERTRLIVSGLRGLGCGAEEARQAADGVADLGDASIEECLRVALRALRPPRSTRREEMAPGRVRGETGKEALAAPGP